MAFQVSIELIRAKGHDLEIVRALETHSKAWLREIEIEVHVVTVLQV